MRLGPIGRRAEEEPDGLALVDDDKALTWRELAAQVTAVARHFAALAPNPDQRVGVLGENRAETVIAHLAGILTGVGTVALSRQLTDKELLDQLADAGAVAVVTGPLGIKASRSAGASAGATVIAHGVDDLPADVNAWATIASSTEGPATDPAAERPPRPPSSTRPGRPAGHAAPKCGGCRDRSLRQPPMPRRWLPAPASHPDRIWWSDRSSTMDRSPRCGTSSPDSP